jgi:Protein of unknown function (DUF1559)
LRKNKPAPRPEMEKAFAAAGNGVAQLVVTPTPDQRRIIEEMLPTLPEGMGGGSSHVLTRGILWAALGVEFGSRPAIHLHIQSQDEGAAKALQDWFEHWLQMSETNKTVLRYLPQFEKLVPLLKPRARGDHLDVVVSDEGRAAPSLFRAAGLAMDFATGRANTANNLKQIALAFHNYFDVHKTFPAIANFDKEGRPLLSWRVHILPFLDENELYKKFHLDEPWDSEHNKKLIPLMPEAYRSWKLTGKPPGYTNVEGPVGKGMFLTGDEHGIRLQDITDGTSNTIMLVETDPEHAVPWTKPEDLKIDKANPAQGLGEHPPGVFVAAFADGSVHFLAITIDKQTLYHLFTINGGEVVDSSKY